MPEEEIGRVVHYYTNIGVCVVELVNGTLKAGDKLHIRGSSTDVELSVDSMQVEHKSIGEAEAGQEIGLKVPDKVRKGDTVFKVTE